MLVSVYIRKADEEKWKALENKTEAVSTLLNGTTSITSNTNTITTDTSTTSIKADKSSRTPEQEESINNYFKDQPVEGKIVEVFEP